MWVIAWRILIVKDRREEVRQQGYSNYEWLRSQALDQETLDFIDMRQADEEAFLNRGIVTEGDEEFLLNFKQGSFYTTRATGHSISHIFVQIFKNKEHRAVPGFFPEDCKVIVDVGANEGFYAHSVAQNSDVMVYSAEPNPVAYNFLRKNIGANNLTNVIPVNYGIWSSKKEAEISIIPQITSVSTMSLIPTSFMSHAMNRVKKVTIQTITLADLVEMYGITHIDLLKIDVEGGELEVFKGGLSILDIVDRIVLEYHSQELRQEVTELLAKYGYVVYYHEPDRDDFGDLYFVKSSSSLVSAPASAGDVDRAFGLHLRG